MAKNTKEINVMLKNVTIFKWNIICEYKEGFAKKTTLFTTESQNGEDTKVSLEII